MATTGTFSLTDKPGPLDDADPDTAAARKKAHRKGLAQFKASGSFFTEQRKRELQDLKFVDFDEQWDPLVKTERSGNTAVSGQPVTPSKPTITINLTRPVCHQVAATRRQANLALEFVAQGNGANDDTAEIYEDLARAMQHDSRADIARNWGADRAEKAGLGWYRIDTDYCEDGSQDGPEADDQDIIYRRILNQSSVYPDPLAQEPDFSDGRFLFVTEDMPWELYKETYGESYLAGAESEELTAIGDEHDDWVFFSSDEGDEDTTRTVRVAEYWFVTGSWRTRDRKVMWAKINGVEFLEEPREWNGRYIPMVPVIWEESNAGGERRWTGLVRPGRDAAISYNVMRSAQVMAVGLATKAPYIGYYKTIEQFKNWWDQSNTRNFPLLPVDEAYDRKGNLLPMPTRTSFEPAIQGITLAANMAKDDVHATTGIPPVSLGDIDPSNRSGAAIKALQGQAETGSSSGLDNLRMISLSLEGKVIKDLLPRVYDRPGRLASGMGEDGTRKMIMLNWPFTTDQSGMPVPVGTPVEGGWPKGQPIPQGASYYNLAEGRYGVTATVGKSHPTQKKEASDAIGNVLQVVPPEFAMAIVPAWLEQQDYPGAKKIAAIAKKALPPNLAAAYQAEGQAPDPAQIMAENQALKGQIGQLTQQIQTEEAKAMAKAKANIMEAQAESQLPPSSSDKVKLAIADMTSARAAQAGISEASIKAGSAQADLEVQVLEIMIKAAKEQRIAREELGAKAAGQAAQNTHDTMTLALEHAHDHSLADKSHAQALAQGTQAAQNDQSLAVTNAALQPPADDSGDDNA